MFSINSYGVHVGACLPCDMAEALVSGNASVGKCGCNDRPGVRVGAIELPSIDTSSPVVIAGIAAVAAAAGYFIAKKMCSCSH